MRRQNYYNRMLFLFRCLGLCLLLVVCTVSVSMAVQDGQYENDLVNSAVIEMSLEGELLKDVVLNISKQTGYKIAISNEWADKPVFGSFQNVGIEHFFRRVLKEKNLVVISNDEEKMIVVRLFGDKKLGNMLVISGGRSSTKVLGVGAVDPMDGQAISEIRALQAENDAEMERWKNDPDAVDPMDGQKISEIKRLQTANDSEMERWKSDPASLDPMDGQRISAIKALQEKNDAEVASRRNDPEAVDSMDGQKISEIRRIQEKNDVEMERWQNDPEAVDPMDGQKLSEIRAIQAEYDAKLK